MSSPCNRGQPQGESFYPSNWYSGLDPFYSIASGIIDGVQSTPSLSTFQDLYNYYLNLNGDIATTDVMNDFSDQLGSQIILGIGCFILFLSWIIGIVVLSVRCCCCKRCYESKPSKLSNPLFSFVHIFIYVTCFSFILTGTILFAQSISNYSNALEGGAFAWNKQIAQDSFLSSLGNQQDSDCAFQTTVVDAKTEIRNQILTQPTYMTLNWLNETGYLDLSSFNESAMSAMLDQDQLQATPLVASLNQLINVPVLSDQVYQKEISDILSTVTASQGQLSRLQLSIKDVMTQTNITLMYTGDETNTVFQQLTSAISPFPDNVNMTNGKILSVMNGLSGVANSSIIWTDQILLRNNDITMKASTWNQYDLIVSLTKLCLNLPVSFTLLFIVIGAAGAVFAFLTNTEPSERGFLSDIIGKILVIGFYFIIFTTWFVIGMASALYWYAYPMSGACTSMYDDSTIHKFYSYSNGPVMVANTFNYSTNVLDYATFLDRCRTRNNLFNVMSKDDDNSIMSQSDIMNSYNIDGYRNAVNKVIDTLNLSVPFDMQTHLNWTFASASLTGSATQLDVINQTSGFLPRTLAVYPQAQSVVNALIAYTNILDQTKVMANNLADVLGKVSDSTQSVSQTRMKNDNNDYFSSYSKKLGDASTQLMSYLHHGLFPSGDLYVFYTNTGRVACDYVRKPLNGMWAASGLASLFFIPAAITMLYTAGWLLRSKTKSVHFGINTMDNVWNEGVDQHLGNQPETTVSGTQPTGSTNFGYQPTELHPAQVQTTPSYVYPTVEIQNAARQAEEEDRQREQTTVTPDPWHQSTEDRTAEVPSTVPSVPEISQPIPKRRESVKSADSLKQEESKAPEEQNTAQVYPTLPELSDDESSSSEEGSMKL